MANKASNAPGFGNGNGKLKTPKGMKTRQKKIYLPRVPVKSY